MRSLRLRLFVGTAAGLLLILSASGVALYLLVRASLVAEFDRALLTEAQALASLVEEDSEGVEFEYAGDPMSAGLGAERAAYFELWLDDGRVLARSRSLGDRDLPRPPGVGETPTYESLVLPGGQAVRGVALRFAPHRAVEPERGADEATHAAGGMVTILLARRTDSLDAALRALAVGLIVVGIVATLVSLAGQAVIVRHGLKPVGRLARRIADVGEHDLSVRFAPSDVPAELTPMVSRLNELLARLGAAFERERALSANVAHELRTPLAGLRSTLEVALTRPREPQAYRATIEECVAICEQTQGMVENLLSLAELERGRVALSGQLTVIGDLLDECWQPCVGRAQERKLRIDWCINGPVRVMTDPDKLRIVLKNVLENAVSYADDGGDIRVECAPVDRGVELRVSNSGCQLTPERAAHVFDRFWRGDAGRSATGMHCGLGLTLCKEIMERLGGTVAVTADCGGRFEVLLRLP